jgi:hypothetical protein
VSLVGIVGVPWQDVATDETRPSTDTLALMDYATMQAAGTWDVILGDPNASPPRSPGDPFMQESVDPRAGNNPITAAPIVAPRTSDPLGTINGHEWDASQNRDDLQYACILQLPPAMQRDCTAPEYTTTDLTTRKGCDCGERFLPRNGPLCQAPGGGETTTTQYFAKAYPGLRHLQVLQGLGPRGVVGSICPKVSLGEPTSAVYGYNPVANAMRAASARSSSSQNNAPPPALAVSALARALEKLLRRAVHPRHALARARLAGDAAALDGWTWHQNLLVPLPAVLGTTLLLLGAVFAHAERRRPGLALDPASQKNLCLGQIHQGLRKPPRAANPHTGPAPSDPGNEDLAARPNGRQQAVGGPKAVCDGRGRARPRNEPNVHGRVIPNSHPCTSHPPGTGVA